MRRKTKAKPRRDKPLADVRMPGKNIAMALVHVLADAKHPSRIRGSANTLKIALNELTELREKQLVAVSPPEPSPGEEGDTSRPGAWEQPVALLPAGQAIAAAAPRLTGHSVGAEANDVERPLTAIAKASWLLTQICPVKEHNCMRMHCGCGLPQPSTEALAYTVPLTGAATFGPAPYPWLARVLDAFLLDSAPAQTVVIQAPSTAQLQHEIQAVSRRFLGRPTEPDDEEKAMLAAGNIIAAIRHMRARSEYGLKEAKDVIDNYRLELPKT